MRKFFNFTLAALSLLFLMGCNSEEMVPDSPQQSGDPDKVFYACLEEPDPETKTYLHGSKLKWSPEEEIGIFENYAYEMSKYRIDPLDVGTNQGSFSLIQQADPYIAISDLGGWNVAWYPYSEFGTLTCEKLATPEDRFLIGPLHNDRVQTRKRLGELDQTFPMVAMTKGDVLHFRNVMGMLRLNLRGTEKVTRIVFQGKNEEHLSGRFYAEINENQPNPELRASWVDMQDPNQQTIELDCGDGVQLYQESDETFLFVVPPTVFRSGFEFYVTTESGATMKIESHKQQVIPRSKVLEMPSVTFEPNMQAIN